MKRTLLFFLSFLCIFSIHAQEEEKSNFVIGGSLTGRHHKIVSSNDQLIFGSPNSNVTEVTNTDIIVLPYIAKCLENNHLIGLRFRYGINNRKQNTEYDNLSAYFPQEPYFNIDKRTLIGFDLFYRYNLLKKGKLNFFFQPNVGYGTSFYNNENSWDTSTSTTNYIAHRVRGSIGVGAIYSLLKKLNLHISIAGIEYQNDFVKNTVIQDDRSTVNLNNNDNFIINTSLSGLKIGIEKIF